MVKKTLLILVLFAICFANSFCNASEMIFVPEGEAIIGSDKYPDEGPVRRVFVQGFYIDKYEVTNREYQKFDPKWRIWPGEEDRPAFVDWYRARAYAKWAGKRLPTEIEWEKAARGTDGREYPWGNEWDPSRCSNWETFEIKPVGSYPEGASPYGVMDMAGNALEWVEDSYLPRDGYKESWPESGKYWRVLKGGRTPLQARCAYRRFALPTGTEAPTGFRCAKDLDNNSSSKFSEDRQLLWDLPNPSYVGPENSVGLDFECNVRVRSDKKIGRTVFLNRLVAQPGFDDFEIMDRLLPLIKAAGINLIRLNILDEKDVKLTQDGEIEIVSWARADATMDWLDRNGISYVFELAPVPAGVPRGPGNAPPNWPQDKWMRYMMRIAEHVSKRRIKPAYWEFWGEPDLGQAWDSKRVIDQYLRMYEATARGILSVIPDAKIGGPIPSNSYTEWLEAFVEFCHSKKLPLRFLTWHQYNASPWRHEMDGAMAMKILSRHPEKERPVLGITEWNTHAGHFITNDSNFNAAYIGVNFLKLQSGSVRMPTFFMLFDGWDYIKPENERFWHRWGMITWDFYPKAAYNIFKLWNMLGEDRVHVTTDNRQVWSIATKKNKTKSVQIMLINFSYPINWIKNRELMPGLRKLALPNLGPSEDPMLCTMSVKPPDDHRYVKAKLSIDGLNKKCWYKVKIFVIDRAHANGFENIARADLKLNVEWIVSGVDLQNLKVCLEPYSVTFIDVSPVVKPPVEIEILNYNGQDDNLVAEELARIKFRVLNRLNRHILIDNVTVSGDDVVLNPTRFNIEREIKANSSRNYEYEGTLPDVDFAQQIFLKVRVGYHTREDKQIREAVSTAVIRVIPKIEVDFFGRTCELGSDSSPAWKIAVKNNANRPIILTVDTEKKIDGFKLAKREFRVDPLGDDILEIEMLPESLEPDSLTAGIYMVPILLNCEGKLIKLGDGAFSIPINVPKFQKLNVDGDLSDWEGLKWTKILSDMHGRLATGPNDLMAEFSCAWDDENLYVAARVVDDKLLQNYEGLNIWKGDSLQIAIDGARDADGGFGYDANDYEIGIAPNSDAVQTVCWYGMEGLQRGPVNNIRAAFKRFENLSIYEVAIPWRVIPLAKSKSGQVIGLALLINDTDEIGDDKKRGYIQWGAEIAISKYTSLFNGARLAN
ncbi:MAG: SUMF1/EgtB/PvdO family nonheme iron enzyme [Candidatus Bathyarchaeia archaeon]